MKYNKKPLVLVLSFFIFLITHSAIAAQKRVALIIGNGDYQDAPLKNPINDASDMADRLAELGFHVEKLINADSRQMKKAISKFGKKLHEENTVGLFYFAGHGIQVDGSNFLLPVKTHIQSEADVEFEAVNAGRVLSQMSRAGNGLNLVILDACRNNPFARSWRSSTRGLAKMEAPKGSLILYATSPGDVAADGSGRNGLFTEKLLKTLNREGLKVEDVFKQTAIAVSNASGKQQVPYIEGVILGDFYFLPAATNVTLKPHTVVQPVTASDSHAEVVFWQSVEKQDNRRAYEAYLKQWPDGQFAALARLKLDTATKKSSGLKNGSSRHKFDEQFFEGKRMTGGTPLGAHITIDIKPDYVVKGEVVGNLKQFKDTGKWYVDQDYYICMKFKRINRGGLICRYPEEKGGKTLLYARDGDPNKPVWELK